MASIDKISASLLAATNENVFALANLNFDFSLVKVTAPPEYTTLGTALTRRRQQDAESGAAHRTARKLGALFEGIIPSIPLLISAYGKRASDIVDTPGVNPSGTAHRHGPFTELIGVDATSVWAAATSGTSSIAVYLLACMLARAFDDPAVATSVWVEVITERQREVREIASTGSNFTIGQLAAANAAQQAFPREEIRQWEASARSWLLAADSAMRKEHTQLQLILKNIRLPVSGGTSLYTDVKAAWINAMTGLERLLAGEPLAVSNAAVLLAISSWHMYPGMVILGDPVKTIQTDDALMRKAGLITVGISRRETRENQEDNGIYWSLALSHYRFYGRPVEVTGTASDRLTMEELHMCAFGSLLYTWGVPRGQPEPAARWIIALWKCVDRAKAFLPRPLWLQIIAKAAENLINSSESQRKDYKRIIDFGQRRGSKFLGVKPGSGNLPWFGLRSPHVLHALCQESPPEAAIRYLREICSHGKLSFEDALITWIAPKSKQSKLHVYTSALPHPITEEQIFMPKTVVPRIDKVPALESDHSDEKGKAIEVDDPFKRTVTSRKHCRWTAEYKFDGDSGRYINVHTDNLLQKRLRSRPEILSSQSMWDSDSEPPSYGDHAISRQLGQSSSTKEQEIQHVLVTPLEDLMGESFEGASSVKPYGLIYPTKRVIRKGLVTMSEEPIDFHGRFPTYQEYFGLWFTKLSAEKIQTFEEKVSRLRNGAEESLVEIDAAIDQLNNQVDPLMLWQYFEGVDPFDPSDFVRPVLKLMSDERRLCEKTITPLRNLAFATTIYNQLPGATIASRIIETGLASPQWGHKDAYTTPTRSDIFSCIAMMETGIVNLKPEGMEKVLGISSGNSLFVLSQLLSDPGKHVSRTAVTRFVGNVGRPGLSLLVLPAAAPLVRPLSDSYRAVSYAPFDGKWENNFRATSLHLSFTKQDFPVDYGAVGAIDHQVYMVECVISAHDGPEWVADLDILDAFDNDKVQRVPQPKKDCQGSCFHRQDLVEKMTNEVTSVDSWEEVLDEPPGVSIVRAQGNWAARLAITTLLAQCGTGWGNGDKTESEHSTYPDIKDAGTTSGRRQNSFAVLEPGGGENGPCQVCVYRRLKQVLKQRPDKSAPFYFVV